MVTRKTKKQKKEMRVEPDYFSECSVYQLQERKKARMQLNENTKQKDKKKTLTRETSLKTTSHF